MANKDYSIVLNAQIDSQSIKDSLSKLQKQLPDLKLNFNTGDINNATKAVNDNADAVDSAMLTYQQANLLLQDTIKIVKSMANEVYALNSAQVDFQKVSDLSGKSLDNYIDGLTKAGAEVARTGSEMTSAAAQFRKSGFNDEDAAKLAKVSEMFRNVGDVAISSEKAAAEIVSQLRAFGWGADQAERIIDVYNAVSNAMSIGTNDLATGMEIGGAALATYNNSFEQSVALLTAGTEILQGRSAQVSRGLMTIAARIASNADTLKQYGIEVADVNGNLKSTYDVLQELKPVWDNLSDAERVSLGNTLAGRWFWPVTDLIDGNEDIKIQVVLSVLYVWIPKALYTNLSW